MMMSAFTDPATTTCALCCPPLSRGNLAQRGDPGSRIEFVPSHNGPCNAKQSTLVSTMRNNPDISLPVSFPPSVRGIFFFFQNLLRLPRVCEVIARGILRINRHGGLILAIPINALVAVHIHFDL